MKVIKHGSLKERKFTCPVCGCVFVANANEYYGNAISGKVLWYNADCPECNGTTTTSEPWEEQDD